MWLVIVVALSTLASLWPALRATRVSVREALAVVVTGEVDAALVDHVSALMVAGGGSELVVVEEPVVEWLGRGP